jgi:hypothetical protein
MAAMVFGMTSLKEPNNGYFARSVMSPDVVAHGATEPESPTGNSQN